MACPRTFNLLLCLSALKQCDIGRSGNNTAHEKPAGSHRSGCTHPSTAGQLPHHPQQQQVWRPW